MYKSFFWGGGPPFNPLNQLFSAFKKIRAHINSFLKLYGTPKNISFSNMIKKVVIILINSNQMAIVNFFI